MVIKRRGDLGCINLAAQIVLRERFGLSPRDAHDHTARIFTALIELAASAWVNLDTPEELARKVLRDLLPEPQSADPWEQPMGGGWPALMETMRRRAGQPTRSGGRRDRRGNALATA